MWVVLCHEHDLPARWAYEGLTARGLAPLVLLTDRTLAGAPRWEHRVGPGGAEVEVTLPDGRVLCSREVRGVLNRLTGPSLEHVLPLVAPDDRQYASQELTAFYLSWLWCLPGPVLNRPTPQGLCGRWRHASEWVCLAARAGLAAADYWQTGLAAPPAAPTGRLLPAGAPAHTVVVAGGRPTGAPVPPAVREACVRLAALAGEGLLGIELAPSPADPWTFVGATPFPDLRLGGPDLLDALVDALKRDAEGAGGAG